MKHAVDRSAPLSSASVAVRIALAFAVIVPCSIIYVTICLLLFPWRAWRIYAGNVYGKVVGRTVFTAAGIRPVIEHRERVRSSMPALFVSNHASTIDMWIGMWLCPLGGVGVAKRELVRLPFFGQALLLSGHLLLDRGHRDRAMASMERARRVVERHQLSVWMYPEGTRSRDGRLQPLKRGFVHLAIATRLPVVPIVVHDADLRWPPRSFRACPGQLRIDVLEPIDTSAWRPEESSTHALEVWSAFQAALGPRQRGIEPAATTSATPVTQRQADA